MSHHSLKQGSGQGFSQSCHGLRGVNAERVPRVCGYCDRPIGVDGGCWDELDYYGDASCRDTVAGNYERIKRAIALLDDHNHLEFIPQYAEGEPWQRVLEYAASAFGLDDEATK